MTDALQPDLGPLNWVKGEIDLALGRATEALEQASQASEPVSRLQFAQTHLHQCRGALSIVGLDGLAQFAEGLDRLLADLAKGNATLTPARLGLAQRGLAAIGNYLDELCHGAPDQALRLVNLYLEIGASRNAEDCSAADLFYPDLSLRPPRRESEPVPLPAEDERKLLKGLRGRFERGLLRWLKAPADPEGPREMREAVTGIEARQSIPSVRGLWWASLAFFDGLLTSPPADLPAARKLCTRLDAQMRRLLTGAPLASDKVMRELLHHLATHPATTGHQILVRDTYRLSSLLPPADSQVRDTPLPPLLKSLREGLSGAREAWDSFSEGSAAALPQFENRLQPLAEGARNLGRPAFSRLTSILQECTAWLRRDPLQQSEALALEVASALLLADSALEPGQANTGLGLRVEDAAGRIAALMAGRAPAAAVSEAATEAARRAEERSATAQLAREMLTTLAQVEEGLDAFFRAPDRHAQLNALEAPLAQLSGALTLLEDPAPQALVQDAATTIRRFAEGGRAADQREFEDLAHHLSALGFFLNALTRGPAKLADYLASAQDQAAAPPAEPLAPVAAPILPPEEQDLEEAPPAPIPPPSEATRQLMASPEDALDAELLAIFIEEAHEVLGTITESLELSRTDPADRETLTTIRRGFHTLKGSGRMVGLTELGEAAWAVEQTLNRWLQLEWFPTPALHHLIGTAQQLFAEWVAQLEAGGSTSKNASAMAAEAERLRLSDTPIEEPLAQAEAGRPAPAQEEQPFEFPELALSATGEILPVALEEALVPPPDEGLPAEIPALETLEFDLTPGPAASADTFTLPEALDEKPLEAEEILALEEEALQPEESAPAFDLGALDLDFDLNLPELPAEPVPPALEQTPEFELETFSLDEELVEPELQQAPETLEDMLPAVPAEALEEEESIEAFALDEAVGPVGGAGELPEPADASPDADTIQVGNATISRPLYDLYLGEARQHLATLRRELARLHINPTLFPPEPAVRAAHTLAGISGTAHIEAAQQLARALEHAQSRLLESEQPPSAEQADILSTAAATLEAMVTQVGDRQLPIPAPELEEQLDGIARQPSAEIRAFELIRGEGRPLAMDSLPVVELPPARAEAVADHGAPALRDDIDEQLLPIFLEEGQELLGQINAVMRDWRNNPGDPAHPDGLARLLHTLKGSARMAGAMALGEFLHQQESRLEAGRETPGAALIDELEGAMDSAGEMIQALAVGALEEAPTATTAVAIDTAEGEVGSAGAATLRLRADLVDRFVNEAGEIGIARTRVEGELRTLRRSLLDLTENVIRLRNQLREVEIQAEVQMQSRIAQTESHHGNFDPLEMDRYTRLQELTRMMAESVGDVTTVQQNLLRNLDGADAAVGSQARLSRDLQQALMRVRMVRFDSLADRIYRIIRQSAKELGRRANLDLRGGAIEIDRGVLEHMTAPLEHLLRNAVAHGIEGPETRQAAGKAEIGQITLAVSQEGNEIVLDLSDDGAGLNFEQIRQKALAQGLLGPDEDADEKRLTNLIFVPGFSTASNLSAVSGRGVGMDVVKAETAAVGGRIDVQSTPGAGTRFRIYLPLTLAVTQALLVRAGHRTYAIPSSMVAQVQELRPAALDLLRANGYTDWQGTRFSYRYLPRLLGDRRTQPEIQKFNWVLLLRAGAQTLALHVDGLRGNQEIVVKNAGPQLARIVGMSGATVLGDGEIVLILNPVALASRHLAETEETAGPDVIPMEPASYLPTILVVDDSLTVRKITGRLLEREGYRVITAKDGVDALEKLLEVTPDVILSDIEMPRMDGFDLVRNIRADQRLSAVPVIMITSRLADKHRRYAEEVGANHYLGKPYQEEELLGLIRTYLGETCPA
ncbi:MAG: Hpt domain-containing protein [Rhodocyclaceae bacterium]|jgi:chemosensory pili system protein ChpA (sensor histidine kinase/response regulator)|nr:Hpt domain-containing protein [Rhodocyclaceae bacterium]